MVRASTSAVFALGLSAILLPTPALGSATALAEVRKELEADCAAGRFSGNVAVREKDRLVLRLSCGLADRAAKRPVSWSTRFKLASVSKPLTAIAVLRLAERRLLSVDDPIGLHIPGVPASWSDIRIRHLLQHTSGIADQMETIEKADLGNHAAAVRSVIAELNNSGHRPATVPGATFAYANFNYELLGLIVARLARRPFERAMDDLLFRPAGMRTAGIEANAATRLALRASTQARLAHAYMPEGLIDEEFAPFYLASGAAYATVGDMLALDDAMTRWRLLSPRMYRRLLTEGVEIRPGYTQALAGLLRTQAGETVWYQWGAMDGFKPFFARVPSRRIAVVVLSNWNDVKPDAIGTRLLDAALAP